MVSNNKKKGFKHVDSQKRSKENIGLIFSDGHLTSKDAEMAFNAIFTFFFFYHYDRSWVAQSFVGGP